MKIIKSYLLESQQVKGQLLLKPPFFVHQIRGVRWIQNYIRFSSNMPFPPIPVQHCRHRRLGVPDQSLGHFFVLFPRLEKNWQGHLLARSWLPHSPPPCPPPPPPPSSPNYSLANLLKLFKDLTLQLMLNDLLHFSRRILWTLQSLRLPSPHRTSWLVHLPKLMEIPSNHWYPSLGQEAREWSSSSQLCQKSSQWISHNLAWGAQSGSYTPECGAEIPRRHTRPGTPCWRRSPGGTWSPSSSSWSAAHHLEEEL